jgi:hypothetical protein
MKNATSMRGDRKQVVGARGTSTRAHPAMAQAYAAPASVAISTPDAGGAVAWKNALCRGGFAAKRIAAYAYGTSAGTSFESNRHS